MAATPIPRYPNVAPVKKVNVPKAAAQPTVYQPTNAGWGAATNANDMSAYGYDVPGTAENPSLPSGAVTTPPPVTGHWNKTDWASMIPGDWEVTDAQALGNQATGAGEAAFQKNLRQAFIDYGGDASKLGDYAKYIDQATIDAALANKQSAVAQNLAAMTKSLRQQRSALAARGILSSGAATQGTTEALTGRESADYAANRAFMGGAGEGLEGLAQLRQDIAGRIASARSSAAARLAQTYPDTWEIDQAAPPPPPPPPSAYVPPPPSSVVPPTLPGETPAERALRLRSEELDRLYGLR